MFMTLVSIIGFVIAITVFLNLLSARESLRASPANIPNDPAVLDPQKVFRMDKEKPRPRICPVCGTMLDQTEYLIASIEPEIKGQKRQAHIYGCRHCFATDGVNLKLSKLEP